MGVDIVDPNFQLPTVPSTTLGFDRELPWWGLIGHRRLRTAHRRTAHLYQNLNLGTPTGVLPDGRTATAMRPERGAAATAIRCAPTPTRRSASGDLPDQHQTRAGADSLSLSLKKPFADNWSGMRRLHAVATPPKSIRARPRRWPIRAQQEPRVDNPNEDVGDLEATRVPQRVIASLTWQHHFFGDYTTSVSAFYDGHSGAPYSWVFGNDVNGDGYAARDAVRLAYIPSRPAMSNSAAARQRGAAAAVLRLHRNNDQYLSDHQGQHRSAATARARRGSTSIDLSFRQEIPGLFKGNKGEIRLDVFNFAQPAEQEVGRRVQHADFPLTRARSPISRGVDPATASTSTTSADQTATATTRRRPCR